MHTPYIINKNKRNIFLYKLNINSVLQPQNIIDSSHPKSPAQLKVKLETVHEDGPSESSTDSIDRNQFTFTPSSQTNSKPTTQTNTTNDLLNIKP